MQEGTTRYVQHMRVKSETRELREMRGGEERVVHDTRKRSRKLKLTEQSDIVIKKKYLRDTIYKVKKLRIKKKITCIF